MTETLKVILFILFTPIRVFLGLGIFIIGAILGLKTKINWYKLVNFGLDAGITFK